MAFTALVTYFVNLVLDFSLQNEFLARNKAGNVYILFVHSAIWGLGIAIVLYYFGLFAWWKVLFLVVGHMIIDAVKARELYRKPEERGNFGRPYDRRDWTALYVDQFLHVVQLAVVLFIN